MHPTEAESLNVPTADVAQLRKEAVESIRIYGSAEKLSEILRKVDDPRLLDRPNEKHDYPDSLLEYSIRVGSVACVRLLIETGADPMASQFGCGFLPVHLLACSSKNMDKRQTLELMEVLSVAGADFNAKDNDGWTPLHFAVNWGSRWFAEILIGRGAPVDPKLLDDLGKIIPNEGDDDRPDALKALDVVQRAVRSQLLGESILSAMPAEGESLAKPSAGMTL